MKRNLLKVFVLFFLFINAVGCKKEIIQPKEQLASNNQTKSLIIDEGQTVLGEKLPNPFTVENMKAAYSILGGSSTDNIVSNQKYVRFLISNPEESKKLEERGLILSTIPLDYEVLQYGTFYNDPRLNNQIWMYTTVPPNFDFTGFQFQIIDDLFLPNLMIGTSQYNSIFNSFDHEDLIDQALKLKGYGNETTEKSIKYRPKGYIKVQQKIISTTSVPVKKLQIRSRWWFDWGIGYTDDNGYFECSAQYRKNRNVNIICIFENQYVNIRAIKGVQIWDMFFTERKNIGQYQNSNLESINYLFQNSTDINSDTKRKWMACHAINSIREHQVYCAQNGVTTPPLHLNLWLTNANANNISLSSSAAAPMLKQISNNSSLVNGVQLFLISSGHPWFAVAIQVLEQYPPDITYNYSDGNWLNEYSDQITQIFYHEFAHASHYNKVGNSYWVDYIQYIVTHLGYGNPTDSGSGRIAISEAWAEFCASRFAHIRFGSTTSFPSNTWLDIIEKFYPNTGTSSWNWIPNGVMHDLTDIGEPTFTGVVDNVSGYTMSQCFGSMDADVISVNGYSNRFKLEYGSAQQLEIDELFKSYGY
jgi:hypothetical protein